MSRRGLLCFWFKCGENSMAFRTFKPSLDCWLFPHGVPPFLLLYILYHKIRKMSSKTFYYFIWTFLCNLYRDFCEKIFIETFLQKVFCEKIFTESFLWKVFPLVNSLFTNSAVDYGRNYERNVNKVRELSAPALLSC